MGQLLGAVLLHAPVPARLKEWAYAAFAITLGSALIVRPWGPDLRPWVHDIVLGLNHESGCRS